MRFIPDHSLNILRESTFSQEIQAVTQRLAQCRNSGFFDSFDGKKIFYEYFLAENSTASVVVVHGLSEFSKKYYELAFYLLNQGYNVFLYDQRCHGLSCRLTDQIDLIHVDSFCDYVADLSVFIDTIVIPADPKPLHIYSHSMGGAVTAMYLAEHTDKIQKAVLSAPLVEPTLGSVPPWLARLGIGTHKLIFGSKKKAWVSHDFDPNYKYETSGDKSFARFTYNMDMRRKDPHYQSTPMTSGWVANCLRLRSQLLSKKIAGRIQTPILMLCAEKDTVVNCKAQLQFAEKCDVCEAIVVKDACHSMLTGSPEIISEHVTRVLDFYRD